MTIGEPHDPQRPDDVGQDATAPRYVYPGLLTQDDLSAMDGVLPEEATAAHLRWLETGEGDPWGGYFG